MKKLFHNRAFVIFVCVVIVLSSTLVNGKRGLEKKYEQIGDLLSASILDFAREHDIDDLEKSARSCLSRVDPLVMKDYDSLISAFTDAAVGFDSDETADVDYAIREFGRFRQMSNRFPAVVFVDLFNLF